MIQKKAKCSTLTQHFQEIFSASFFFFFSLPALSLSLFFFSSTILSSPILNAAFCCYLSEVKSLQTLISRVVMKAGFAGGFGTIDPLVSGIFLMNLVEVMWSCTSKAWGQRKAKKKLHEICSKIQLSLVLVPCFWYNW